MPLKGEAVMLWLVYRGLQSFQTEIRHDIVVKSDDHLFDLLLNRLVGPSRFSSESKEFYRKCGQSYTEGLHENSLFEESRSNKTSQRSEPSTYPCNNCGIRFSANLMENGICNGCRKGRQSTSENANRGNREVGASITHTALNEAYQILGCGEKDSDEIIKDRHRELAKEFHADHLSHGTSLDQIRHANESFCQVQKAYEMIMISRKNRT
jgi:hypothetical protein